MPPKNNRIINAQQKWIPDFLKELNPSILPWQESMALDPIRQLLNAPIADQAERTRVWKDMKLAELSSLAVTASLVMMELII
jgi:hypothetical protein